jgi:hypothetical protein
MNERHIKAHKKELLLQENVGPVLGFCTPGLARLDALSDNARLWYGLRNLLPDNVKGYTWTSPKLSGNSQQANQEYHSKKYILFHGFVYVGVAHIWENH